MSTVKPQGPATNPVAPSYRSSSAQKKTSAFMPKNGDPAFLFGRENFMLMIGGIVLILLGFMLMSGGKSADPHQFNYDEIYSFRRITLAPIVILIGFGVEIYAIMKKPKETN